MPEITITTKAQHRIKLTDCIPYRDSKQSNVNIKEDYHWQINQYDNSVYSKV